MNIALSEPCEQLYSSPFHAEFLHVRKYVSAVRLQRTMTVSPVRRIHALAIGDKSEQPNAKQHRVKRVQCGSDIMPRLHQIHVARIQVVSTCIHLYPLSPFACILYRRQNYRHGYMYPLISASRTLLRACIRRHLDR